MGYSPLATYKKISPNKTSPRNHKIDTITIHCAVCQKTAKDILNLSHFVNYSDEYGVSCNYAVGCDGSIGVGVDENDRSWCSSSGSNDHRAITIEVASDTTAPYKITDKAYKALIQLCADICKRNGIKELKWKADKSLIGKISKQNMTVHRWFANKDCPGDYIYNRLGTIAVEVNDILKKKTTKKSVTASEAADKFDKKYAGTYKTTANLRLRDGEGTSKKTLCIIPKGTKVKCFGYYSTTTTVRWLYIQTTVDGVEYTGFSSSRYLKK